MARAISKGVEPLADLALSHTTAVMYLLAPLAELFPEPRTLFISELSTTLLATVVCGVIVFRNGRSTTLTVSESGAAAALSVLSLLILAGTIVQLEP